MATPFPIIPGFVSNRVQDEHLNSPAAPYAPPTPKPLGPAHKLSPVSNRDLPASTVRPWAVEIVRGAIDQMAEGFFQDIADLSQYMRRDSAFSAAMEKRVLGLLRNPMRFEPASDSPLDQEVCDAVERFWHIMAPEVELRKWVEWFHLLNVSVASVDWLPEIDPGGRVWKVPRVRSRHMKWFRYDTQFSSILDYGSACVTTVNQFGGRYLVAQTWKYGEFAGKASALGEDWIEKVFARRDWAEWSDFYSWPIFKAIVPAGGLSDETISAAFVSSLQSNVRNRTVAVARGVDGNNTYDFEAVPLSGDEWSNYPARIQMLDTRINIAWLGNNLSTEISDGGSRAAASTHQSAETRLIQSDNVVLSQALCDQLIRFFVTENYGQKVAVPKVGWVVGVEEELKSRAAALKDFAEFYQNIQSDEYEITNLPEIAHLFGVELKKRVPDSLEPLMKDTTKPQKKPLKPTGKNPLGK